MGDEEAKYNSNRFRNWKNKGKSLQFLIKVSLRKVWQGFTLPFLGPHYSSPFLGKDADERRRVRNETIVNLRKEKKEVEEISLFLVSNGDSLQDSLNKRRNVPDCDYEDDFENEDGRARPNLGDIVENAKSQDTEIQLKAIQGDLPFVFSSFSKRSFSRAKAAFVRQKSSHRRLDTVWHSPHSCREPGQGRHPRYSVRSCLGAH